MIQTSCRWRGSYFAVFALLALAIGCSKPDDTLNTIRGLQEQNRVLREQIEGTVTLKESAEKALREQIELTKQNLDSLRNQKESGEQGIKQAHEQEIKKLEDIMAKNSELHRKEVGRLTKEIATFQLELGSLKREKIALQEIADQRPQVDEARRVHLGIEVITLIIMIVCLILWLGFMAFKYRAARDRLHLVTMTQVSQLRQIGSH